MFCSAFLVSCWDALFVVYTCGMDMRYARTCVDVCGVWGGVWEEVEGGE